MKKHIIYMAACFAILSLCFSITTNAQQYSDFPVAQSRTDQYYSWVQNKDTTGFVAVPSWAEQDLTNGGINYASYVGRTDKGDLNNLTGTFYFSSKMAYQWNFSGISASGARVNSVRVEVWYISNTLTAGATVDIKTISTSQYNQNGQNRWASIKGARTDTSFIVNSHPDLPSAYYYVDLPASNQICKDIAAALQAGTWYSLALMTEDDEWSSNSPGDYNYLLTTQSIHRTQGIKLTVNYTLPINITIQNNFSDGYVTVGSTNYPSPYTPSPKWYSGDPHTILSTSQSGYTTLNSWTNLTTNEVINENPTVIMPTSDAVYQANFGVIDTVDQKLSTNASKGSIDHWENNASFVSYTAPHPFNFLFPSTQCLRGVQDTLSGEKYNTWYINTSVQSNVANHHVFSIDSMATKFKSQTRPVTQGQSIKINLIDSPGDCTGTISFKDPWLIDYPDAAYGNQMRNQGMNAPFKDRTAPFSPDISTNYNGDVYKGVFLNQYPPTDTSHPPYYSVSAPQSQSLINGITSYFVNWSGNGATLQQPNSLSSAVVFNSANATVTANYKAHLGSSLPDATGGNGRKTVADQNGVQYVVYSSAGSIWFIHTDGSGGWTQEVKLGDGKNPSIAITSSNELRLVWEQDPGNGTRIVYYRRSTDGGAAWQAAVTLATPTQAYDATPIALPASYIRALWRGTDGLYASIYYNIQGIDFIPSHLSLPSTAKSPSAAAMGDQVIELGYQDGNAIKYVELSYNTYYLSGNPVEASIPNTTGNANPSISSDYSLVYLAWEDTTNHKLYIRHSDDAGENWGSIKEIAHGTDQLSKPSIGFDAVNGYTTLLFQCGSQVGESVLIDFDTTWTPPIMLGEGMSPTIDANIGNGYPSVPLRTVGSSAPYTLNPMTLPGVWEFSNSTISSNTTWEGVLWVDGTVTINAGCTLTVNPGAVILFANGGSLIVNGTLNAVGTGADSIIFGRAVLTAWGGIQFNSGSSGSVEYCNIGDAANGISLNGTNSPVIAYNTITNCSNYGIYCYSASPNIYHNKITASQYGLRCDHYSSPTLGAPGSPAGQGNNVIARNYIGIYASGSTPLIGTSSGPAAGYNSIYNNTNFDLIATGCGSIWAQNNWWNGTPKLLPLYTTIYSTPLLTSNPNAYFVPGAVKTPHIAIASASTTPTVIDTKADPADAELNRFLSYELKGNYDEALTGYMQRFKKDTSVTTRKYLIARLSECYCKGNKKDFAEFLNTNVRTTLVTTDELYAATLEVESINLIRLGSYSKALENYKTLTRMFSNNDDVYKHALFNAWHLYYHQLNDTIQGKTYFARLQSRYPDDELTANASFIMGVGGIKGFAARGLDKQEETSSQAIILPTTFGLQQNYPNPFNPVTTIAYQLPGASLVSLKIYDMLGREVVMLAYGVKDAGYYTAAFNGSHLASGVYFARFVATPQNSDPNGAGKQFIKTMKMLLTK